MSTMSALTLAIQLAHERRDEAGRGLMQAQRAYMQAQNQLDQLETYAADTEARWVSAAQIAMSTGILQHHYQFMERLRHAIHLQEGVLADMRRQIEAAKLQVQLAETKLAGLQKVLASQQRAWRLKLAQREQRETDEFAAMQYTRNMAQRLSGEIA